MNVQVGSRLLIDLNEEMRHSDRPQCEKVIGSRQNPARPRERGRRGESAPHSAKVRNPPAETGEPAAWLALYLAESTARRLGTSHRWLCRDGRRLRRPYELLTGRAGERHEFDFGDLAAFEEVKSPKGNKGDRLDERCI